MRLIDADALHYNRIRIAYSGGTIGGYTAVVMSAEIKDAPTVDAVPVVRCRECEHGEYDDKIEDEYCYHCRYDGFSYNEANHFCSDGKRKGGDE